MGLMFVDARLWNAANRMPRLRADRKTECSISNVWKIDWGGRPLVLETGKVARQADGAVVATYGDTTVIATAVADRSPKPGLDFFPLTVNYQEKTYAAGKIPGGYFKREGRPSEKETLVSRLIDRPIRPLFPKGFKCETQIVATVLSHDLENDPDIVAMAAVSAALTISGIPFLGPIGAARVGMIDGAYVLNPTLDQMEESKLDLVVAGTHDAVMMVESEASELTEDEMLGAVSFGHKAFQDVISAAISLAEQAAREPRDLEQVDNSATVEKVAGLVDADLRAAYQTVDKQERQEAVAQARDKAIEQLGDEEDENAPTAQQIGEAFKSLEKTIVRGNILDTGSRIDGRALVDVRQIVSEVGVLPRAHGTALFTRGETQALVVTHARHRRGRAVRGCAGGNLQAEVPPALQLPALLGGRNRPRRLYRPPRNRPRQARLAGAEGGPARRR